MYAEKCAKHRTDLRVSLDILVNERHEHNARPVKADRRFRFLRAFQTICRNHLLPVLSPRKDANQWYDSHLSQSSNVLIAVRAGNAHRVVVDGRDLVI